MFFLALYLTTLHKNTDLMNNKQIYYINFYVNSNIFLYKTQYFLGSAGTCLNSNTASE